MAYEVQKEAKEFYFHGNDTGILVIHGFTGTTQSMRFIGKELAKAGFTVYAPRLTGHGTAPEDMENATYQEWIKDVEKGYDKLRKDCMDVFVVGLSMGGTLALYLAEHRQHITGVMTINAATNMPELIGNFEKLSATDTRFVNGIGSDIKREGVEELVYKQTPVRSMGEIIALKKEVREKLHEIHVPALIFKSAEDHVVPPENSDEIHQKISSEKKELITLENSYHVATLDNDKEFIAEKCITFIRENR